jgi:hypothetical protein
MSWKVLLLRKNRGILPNPKGATLTRKEKRRGGIFFSVRRWVFTPFE